MLFALLLAVLLRLAARRPRAGLLWIGAPPALAVRLCEQALDDRTWRDETLAAARLDDLPAHLVPSLRTWIAEDDTRYIPGIGRRRVSVRP